MKNIPVTYLIRRNELFLDLRDENRNLPHHPENKITILKHVYKTHQLISTMKRRKYKPGNEEQDENCFVVASTGHKIVAHE